MEIRETLAAGNIYHICTKSNSVEKLFQENRDYAYFIRKMEERLTGAWEILAFTLLPCEIHFVVKIVKRKIDGEIVNHSMLLSHLLNGYVQHYNYKYLRSGSLLTRSFFRKSITCDEELKTVICKIHNLPVVKKMVKTGAEWVHGSYSRIKENKFGLRQLCQVLELFGGRDKFDAAHANLTEFLENIFPKKKWAKLLHPLEIAFRMKNPLGVHRWARRISHAPE